MSRSLVIACGALARELLAITRMNGLDHISVECLPATLHNRPGEIPEAVRARIRRARSGVCAADEVRAVDEETPVAGSHFDSIFVAYADCGTGGLLAKVCEEEGVEMMAGAHCYEFFATAPRFAEIQDAEIGSFYLTDFLARNFDRMVWQGLGLDRHPELLPMYFGNYTRLVYLSQTDDPSLLTDAERAAERLGLPFVVEHTGYGELRSTVVELSRALR